MSHLEFMTISEVVLEAEASLAERETFPVEISVRRADNIRKFLYQVTNIKRLTFQSGISIDEKILETFQKFVKASKEPGESQRKSITVQLDRSDFDILDCLYKTRTNSALTRAKESKMVQESLSWLTRVGAGLMEEKQKS